MSVDSTSSVPATITAGDTIRVSLSAGSSYPATSWTGALGVLGPDTDKRADWAADGDDHAFTFSSGTTATWAPGQYTWSFVVTEQSSNERARVSGGEFYVTRDPLAEVPYQSHNEKILAGLKAFQKRRVDGDGAETFSIDGQSFTLTSMREVTRQVGIYSTLVRRERNRELKNTSGLKCRTIVFK